VAIYKREWVHGRLGEGIFGSRAINRVAKEHLRGRAFSRPLCWRCVFSPGAQRQGVCTMTILDHARLPAVAGWNGTPDWLARATVILVFTLMASVSLGSAFHAATDWSEQTLASKASPS
jgi:hypothetical protein